MRIAIVGAGDHSDCHIRFAKAYAGAQIVGVVDTDLARAEEVARTHRIERTFASTAAMLRDVRPDVVHVVTPPATHLAVAREVLDAGCHVLVETPLTLNTADARALYDLAEQRGVRLCPVHNHLFDPCMRRAADVVSGGAIGDVVRVESDYALDTNSPAFRDYPRPNVLPWLYDLPGGPYHNFLSHAIYPVIEYTGFPRSISVTHRSTGGLPQRLPDEIRILIDGERAVGAVTVSFAAKPHLHSIRVYGTGGMVEVDLNTRTVTAHPASSLPTAAAEATNNLRGSIPRTRSAYQHVVQFVTARLKPNQGMTILIHQFYDAIKSGGASPISKQRALDVVETMDAVFRQMSYEPLKHENIDGRPASVRGCKVLVTGGTGFLGKAVVRRLLADGYGVRILARKLATVDALAALGAEIFWGDVADLDSFDQAFAGCDAVVHLAAGTSGSEKDSQTATLQGTRNLLGLSRKHKPSKLVYISSCSVYGVAQHRARALIPETSALERFPERRGSYSASKQRAEVLVTDFMKSGDVPVVILRPGSIYGTGGELYTGMMGFSIGSTYVVLGMGGYQLPLVYVDNLADAIAMCLNRHEADGEIFNVIDPEPLNKRAYMNRVLRRAVPHARVLYLPLAIFYGLVWIQEIAFTLMQRPPILTRYRIASSQRSVRFDGRKLADKLGWQPAVSLSEALDRLASSALTTRTATRTRETSSLSHSSVQAHSAPGSEPVQVADASARERV